MTERRQRRRSEPTGHGPETLDVRTTDGWSLRVDVHEPEEGPVGVVVLAHAAMARRTSFERPVGAGVASFLVERGWRVIAFDFRGHGDSGPAGGQRETWGYDDLVAYDIPAVFSFAQSRAVAGRPVVALGHSLGGHVVLAAQGTRRAEFDRVVSVASNVWTRELEPSLARWLAKRAALRGGLALCRRVGRLPARALRAGSDDESRPFFEDFERFSRTGWRSRDGQEDYRGSLANVRCDVLQLVSDGDRLVCAPECGRRFIQLCGGKAGVEHVSTDDDGGPAPTHMGIVTSGKIASAWARVERWMRAG
jgi:predicted alpha/beta hydrolase